MEAKPLNRGEDRLKPHSMLRKLALALVFVTALVLAGGQHVQAASLQKTAIQQRYVMVLDAGHGGNDPGAIDPVNGYLEADIAQQMTERLHSLLLAHKDELQVVLAHEAGENPNVTQRGQLATDINADLLVSLHLNASTNTAARGFSVYPTPPGEPHHEESLRAAETVIGRVRETGIPVMGEGENGVYYCFYYGSEKKLYDSAVYANMQNIAKPTFGVLRGSDCPSILVEQWFISNHEDMATFNTPEGKDAMALQLYRGICDYFGIEAIY